MSKYTTELRFICENLAGLDESEGYNSVQDIINDSYDKIFDFNYPIFDETYKPVLEKKIIKHYYTREIGSETYGRWKLWLDARMNEIMPYYNKLYESELLEFNPFYDADYTKSGTRTLDDDRVHDNSTIYDSRIVDDGSVIETTTTDMERQDNLQSEREDLLSTNKVTALDEHRTTESDQTRTDNLTSTRTDNLQRVDRNEPQNDHWDYYNDTPQGGLSGIQTNTYLTDVRHITDSGTGSVDTINDTGTQTNADTGTQNIDGEVTDAFTADNSETISNTGTQTTTNTGTVTTQGTVTSDKEHDLAHVHTGTDRNAGTATIDSTEEYAEHVVGKFPGSNYSKLLKDFRDTFLNIDMLIIRDLNDLFMTLW